MTVLERQREATIKWQQHLQNNQPPYLTDFNVNVNAVFSSSSSSSQSQGLVMNICADSALGEVLTHSVKPDPGVWPEFDAGFGSSSGFLPTISPTCSRGGDLVSPKENMASAKENTKKRKPQNSKVVVLFFLFQMSMLAVTFPDKKKNANHRGYVMSMLWTTVK